MGSFCGNCVDLGALKNTTGDCDRIRHVNRASKLANTRNKAKKRAELHAWILEGMLNLSVGLFNSIQWQRLTWYPNTRLYPNVPFDKATDKPTRHPTPAEVQKACKFADRNFYLMNAGRPVLLDPRNPESVIAIMDFTLQLSSKNRLTYPNNNHHHSQLQSVNQPAYPKNNHRVQNLGQHVEPTNPIFHVKPVWQLRRALGDFLHFSAPQHVLLRFVVRGKLLDGLVGFRPPPPLLFPSTMNSTLASYPTHQFSSCFPRSPLMSLPCTPFVTPPTPASQCTPPAALGKVSHRRFRLWSAPNPASASRCSRSLVASPQHTLNPSPQSAVNPKARQYPVW
ncbi:hypothetical protein PGT21_020342 [Puccinia graminis f. sp. tritici]|uniref:Uncharacterized protein n=1 Tax=Puccinia graminis f. sp. tritici TaxID=56615 RepID=A0A5B0M3T3_PUCGR|nr:hypothetical protein PGT21_020342 [Puccinia graminis f. sp. tritici]